MTGSWIMDAYIIGSAILIVYPLSVFIYREFINKKG